MSCNMCKFTHLMYGNSKYPDGAEICCNIERIDGEPTFTMTAYVIAHPEYEAQTVYRGWVPINNCPWCGEPLRGDAE